VAPEFTFEAARPNGVVVVSITKPSQAALVGIVSSRRMLATHNYYEAHDRSTQGGR
jgi:hypothetical protein